MELSSGDGAPPQPRRSDGSLSARAWLRLIDSDNAAIAKVQSSWAVGYQLTQAGEYVRALNALRATYPFIRRIRDDSARTCVANGADNLIGSAAAGNAYLVAHLGDLHGARGAAASAWHVFLDCR
jgi:hypothetical protein